ncbi:hypothetical protein, partial [Oceanobacillus oncorhynchi]|uniref:hypothetical protein n=1 Tax=Oceanobacillus oncorhynchi TaxID=545501 RepID=UPI001BB3A6EA
RNTASILSFKVCLLLLLDIENAPNTVVENFYYFSVHCIGSISQSAASALSTTILQENKKKKTTIGIR